MAYRNFLEYDNIQVPQIKGAKGGKGGGGGEPYEPTEDPQSLFSTDILFAVVGLGEGPVYRINPNGPQDIELSDSSVDDLLNLDGNGLENTSKFKTLSTTGTTTQGRLDVFGETTVTPQNFASPVSLKSGSSGIPQSGVILQDTSANDWDALEFSFVISSLRIVTEKGDILRHTISIKIDVFDRLGTTLIATASRSIGGKTDAKFKFSVKIQIPEEHKNSSGYKFSVAKTSPDTTSSTTTDTVALISWNEIENSPQAYPRTAHIGYALKATNEHNGVPTFTSLVKGLLHKVPSNYNQPTLANGEIDWRHVEVPATGASSPATAGYFLQATGTEVQTSSSINIYKGSWDGSFVYSWSQNPVWIIYDILTNKTYGLSIPEENIDKYRFYQIAQYCDACDATTGNFVGVDGLSDGTFKYKPRNTFTAIREKLLGLAEGTEVKERRFILDVLISDQSQSFDTINTLAASFRSSIMVSHGKITLSSDLPDETPVMVFNEATMKHGSFSISGNKESEIVTGVDVSYIDTTNHYKRETVRIDQDGSNDGIVKTQIENIASLDLSGVTRRSQAIRFAQYHIASSKYIRRVCNFTTSTDALQLIPGDVIAVSQQANGVAYGFGGKIHADSPIQANNTNVFVEHFTVPSLSSTDFTANTGALVLRVIKLKNERIDLYIASKTTFALSKTDNVTTGFDLATINPIKRYNDITRNWDSYTAFTANTRPEKGDLWTFGEIETDTNPYTAKSDKLFKVIELSREPSDETVQIVAAEYISNIYVDSDTFIDYKPTAYTDLQSGLTVPPVPNFTFEKNVRARLDGSLVTDGLLLTSTEKEGFGITYITQYEIAKPSGVSLVANANLSGLSGQTIHIDNSSILEGSTTLPSVTLAGKNGFSSPIGEVKLLCTAIENTDTVGGTKDGNIQLTLEGFRDVFDENFNVRLLDANDSSIFGTLKGSDHITIPINEKSQQQGLLNFVGFAGIVTNLSQPIVSSTPTSDTIKIENIRTEDVTLINKIPAAPFYVTLNQLLDSRFYNNNSFYVSGQNSTYVKTGEVTGNETITIDLPVRPRNKTFVRFYVDGSEKSSGQYDLNHTNTAMNANIVYSSGAAESAFRTEIDYYNVPVFEIGDNVQTSHANVFSIVDSSFDPLSLKYNASLTANYIYRVYTHTEPKINLAGFTFTNISIDPVGALGNISGGSGTFDYDNNRFPGKFELANNRVYNLEISSDFESLFLTKDSIVPDLGVGTTSVRARNKTRGGRTSAYNTQSINVEFIPIRKVENITIVESLYREQTGGVAVRVTIQFDHILQQNVTDYEISYKLDSVDDVGSDDGGTDLTSFNTVKVPAIGVDSDGKIRFTVNGVNRGQTSDTRNIVFRIVPLNKEIRGITAIARKSISGKTDTPANIFNFTGGQQTDQITLLWSYPRTSDGELTDIDLKEVVIKRISGSPTITTNENRLELFVISDDLVTVSAGTARKSIPIDTFGEFTYIARTRDTSGNFSDDVVAIVITTTRPNRSTVIKAYSEDAPTTAFAGITNDNSSEAVYPSFTTSNSGGLAFVNKGDGHPSSIVDNANGTSSGFSAAGVVSDLLAGESAEYITSIRDAGSTVTGAIFVDITGSQAVETTFNDSKETYLSGVTDASGTAGVLKDASFGGIGHVLGFSNTAVVNPRFDSNNQTFMTGGASGNVFAIWDDGKYTGNVITITGITKANPAVVTTSGSEHGLVNGNRIIIHDVNGMTQINNRELYVNRVNATSVQLYTNAGRTAALNSSGFDTYTSSGVLDQGDYANANSYALIAGVVDADEIRLGASYLPNGNATGSNALANITTAASSYKLVNFKQYIDTGSGDTFAGTLGAVTSQTLIRTTTAANAALYYANGNVDISQFIGSAVNDGFQTYQAGSRTFRQFQLKFIVQNKQPDEFDFTIDKFRYTIEKDTVTFTDTIAYDATTKTVDITSAGFLNRPVISYAMLSEDANKPHIVVTTAASNQAVSFQVFKSDDSGAASTSSGMSVMITATGV
tara:strand:- start:1738 stop:7743 length:6006 start_codon:yes stop_codon:yes gene_type:complete